ncbi:MAG: methyltransferase [Desulfurococcaceae archaeon]
MVVRTRVTSKSELELLVAAFDKEVRPVGKRELEQYPTPAELVAHMTWIGHLKGDIESKTISDLGCGDARLAIGSLLLGARRAVCVDVDEDILRYGTSIVERHFRDLRARLISVVADATEISLNSIDTIIMNPPFGVVRGNRGLDVKFLLNAVKNSKSVYSIHKYSRGFIEILQKLVKSWNRSIEWFEVLNLSIPMMYQRHRRKVYRVKSIFLVLRERGLNELHSTR